MIVKSNKQTVVVRISPKERDVLNLYTDIPVELIQRINDAMAKAQSKRTTVKRVVVPYTIKELNTIITKIALKANQNNTLSEVQYVLGCLFGKLATLYNSAISGNY